MKRLLEWHGSDSKTLNSLIKEEMPSVHKLPELYWPSLKSTLLLVVISVILLIPSHIYLSDNFPKLIFDNSYHYQNLIAIHAGMAAIIFALIIFIAQRSSKDQNEARVLLKVSYLYPLLVLTIIGFFNFIWFDINILAIIPLITIGIFIIYSTSRLIAILFNRYQFSNEYLNLLKDRFERSIKLAIDERIGNNILLGNLEEEIKLEYRLFSIKDKHKFYNFYSHKKGIITDINLSKLKEFADIVDSEGRDNGYSFYKDEIKSVSNLDHGAQKASLGDQEPYKVNRERFLLKKYKDTVDETTLLICIDKNLINDYRVVNKFKKLIKEIFIVEDKDENFSEEIRLELRDIKDQLINAIKNENLGRIEDSYKIYPKLEEAFIKLLTKYGGKYTFKQAQKERGAFFGGWNEIKWLSNDIREIFNVGMASKNKDIIRTIGFLPVLMARKAMELDDHYFFQEFIDFVVDLYRASQRESNHELKSLMIDRSWMYLKETSKIIEFKLDERSLAKEELFSLKDFSIYLLIMFQALLEETKRKSDLKSFKRFNKSTKQLFIRFKPSQEHPTSEDLEWQLENYDLSDKQKNELEPKIKEQKILEEIEKEIKNRKGQMFFGLATYVFENFRKDQSNKDKKKFYLEIESSLPDDFKKFTKIFLSAHTIEADNFWGWIRWEELPEDRAVFIDTMGKLERYYVIRALRLLKNLSEKEIGQIVLSYKNKEYNRDLALLASDKFVRLLDEIYNNPDEWKFILDGDEIARISSFKKLLEISVEIWEEIEKKDVRLGKISDKKINEFKEEVLQGFEQWANLRKLFNHFGLYVDKTSEVNEKLRFGLNRIDNKAVFFEKWHIRYPNWGIEYGKDMAIGENFAILKSILDQCEEIQEINFEKKLEKFEELSEVIILVAGPNSSKFIREPGKFFYKRHYECPESDLNNLTGFSGCYRFKDRNISVFHIFGTKIDKLVILKKSNLGKLVQYSPLDEEDKDLVKDIFYMNIQAFSEHNELIDEFLGESIDWLEEIGNKEEQRKYLEEKVWIQIFERFEYKKDEKFEGYFLEFIDD